MPHFIGQKSKAAIAAVVPSEGSIKVFSSLWVGEKLMKNSEQLENLIHSSDNLPTLPGIALKILEAFQKPEPDVNEIAELLSTDPPLTAKVLKIVNSAFYSLSCKITSVQHAIKLLGISTIKNLALSFALVNRFQSNQTNFFDYVQFWKNSLIGATASKVVTERIDSSLSSDAFFLGLLQDIGMLTIGHCMPRQYSLILKEMDNRHGSNLLQAENEILGFNHQEIGEYLTKSWQLPDIFHLPIGYHHDPEKLPTAQPNIEKLTKILYISSLYIELFDNKLSGFNLWLIEDAIKNFDSAKAINIDQIGTEISQFTQQLFPIFEIDVDQSDYIQILESARAESAKLSEDMISNLLDQHREIETLKRQVTRDSMTQLHNHQHFRELLHNELSRAERYQRPLSLVLADIDHFKSINDTYGHLAGDHVIKAVAAKLTMEVRESDYVARYGGEEFAMILTETDSEQAAIAAERLRSEIAGLNLSIAGNSISPTMSFGISSLPTNQKIDINELINRADKALYRAKGNGRNQCCTYS